MAKERSRLLLEGSALCFIPAILFLPLAGLFTICPPSYGLVTMKIIALVFCASAILGIVKLVRIMRRDKNDAVSWFAVVSMLAGLWCLFLGFWCFIVPLLHN